MKHIVSNYEEYEEAYMASINDPESFWGGFAEEFQWKRKWDRVVNADLHKASIKWFEGAKLNITENCIDRHLADIREIKLRSYSNPTTQMRRPVISVTINWQQR